MKLSTRALLFFVMTCTLVGCVKSGPCIERTSDGPWQTIGQQPLPVSEIENVFANEGTAGIIKKYGIQGRLGDAPAGEVSSWVFEARRVATHKSCNPERTAVTFSQSFMILTIKKSEKGETCIYEEKEFISDRLYSVEDALKNVSGPLGTPARTCGIFTSR